MGTPAPWKARHAPGRQPAAASTPLAADHPQPPPCHRPLTAPKPPRHTASGSPPYTSRLQAGGSRPRRQQARDGAARGGWVGGSMAAAPTPAAAGHPRPGAKLAKEPPCARAAGRGATPRRRAVSRRPRPLHALGSRARTPCSQIRRWDHQIGAQPPQIRLAAANQLAVDHSHHRLGLRWEMGEVEVEGCGWEALLGATAGRRHH